MFIGYKNINIFIMLDCLEFNKMFVPAKGGLAVGKTKRGKGTKVVAIPGAAALTIAVHEGSASPHEVRLVEATIDSGFTE